MKLFQFIFFVLILFHVPLQVYCKYPLKTIHIPEADFTMVRPDQEKTSCLLADTMPFHSIEEINSLFDRGKFEQFRDSKYRGKVSNNYGIWRELTVVSLQDGSFFIDVGHAELITLYLYYRNGKILKMEGGSLLPSSKLTVPFLPNYFKIQLLKGEEVKIFAHLRNTFPYALFFNLTIRSVENFWKVAYSQGDKIMYAFLGAVLIMIFYNLLLYITARDKTYLLYVLYMLTIFITNVIDTRILQKLAPSLGEYPTAIFWITILASQMIGISYISFARKFINMQKYSPAFDQFLHWWIRLRILSIPVLVYISLGLTSVNMTHFMIVTDVLMGFIYVVIVYRSKNKIGRYFVWGGTALVLGAALTVLEIFNIYLFGERTNGIPLQAGILLELILFSVGLGIRVRMNEEEKRGTETQLLNQLIENEKLQTKVTMELEIKVKLRTEEIQKRNQEIIKQNLLLVGQKEELEVQAEAIKKANDEVNVKNEALKVSLEKLKITQGELVQSEKMASLGQLTAGIAHEINNPINFVSANIHPLKNDFSEIQSLFRRYKQLHIDSDCKSVLESIKKYETDMDADYMFEEIGLLLNGIEEGAFRTREIVLGLRNFSRMEENNFKPTNIHAGLDSTLMLIQGKIKNRINVIKNYDHQVPLVECFPGKINQVFMNILTNALQAIPEKGVIIISTQVEQDHVTICFKDNGQGMSREVKHKIFEPFFTTKKIGKGTGLGLSISYGIIEDHRGKIEVNSHPGKGSEFIIRIPLKQP